VRSGSLEAVRPAAPTGYTLVAIMIFLAILTISVLVVAPTLYKVMQREREEELLFRGKQYAMAIMNFQRRQGRLPMELKELMKTQPRSARKLFKEPMCDCDDWGLIHPGDPWPRPRVDLNSTDGAADTNPTGPRSSTSSPFPSTYGTPPSGTGSTDGGRGASPGRGQGNGAGFSGDTLFQNTDQGEPPRPIIGVYSKLHKKGLRTFKGYEYYDDWGFIAGQNNDDIPSFLIRGVPRPPSQPPPQTQR
jgi:type II secretory pathway pseudopilin PulG